jgi:hypothetical protein
MTRKETVAAYAEEFLKGRSEEARAKFFAKSLDKQYQSVMSFRRRQTLKNQGANAAGVAVGDVVRYLRQAHNMIQQIDVLTDKGSEKIRTELENLKETINNFEQIKTRQEIEKLNKEIETKNKLKAELESRLG